MTDQEQARRIVMAVKMMSDDEAGAYVADNLKLIRTQGERAGLDRAAQMIREINDSIVTA